MSARTTQLLEGQCLDPSHTIPPPSPSSVRRGSRFTFPSTPRTRDNGGQRILLGTIKMEVLGEWNHEECTKEQASLSWTLRRLQHRAEEGLRKASATEHHRGWEHSGIASCTNSR